MLHVIYLLLAAEFGYILYNSLLVAYSILRTIIMFIFQTMTHSEQTYFGCCPFSNTESTRFRGGSAAKKKKKWTNKTFKHVHTNIDKYPAIYGHGYLNKSRRNVKRYVACHISAALFCVYRAKPKCGNFTREVLLYTNSKAIQWALLFKTPKF